MRTSFITLFLAAGLLIFLSTSTIASATIGIIKSVSGDVYLTNTTSAIKAVPNMRLNQGDSIRTGSNSNAGLIFEDDTVVSLGSNSEMSIEKFLFDPATEKLGTTITIHLPATDQPVSSISKQIPLDRYRGKETVLVVDDLQEQLTIASNMLKKFGYNVIATKNGSEPLELLARSQVDLVMLDMIMPGQLDGLETYEEILKLHPGQKAIMASGYSESDRVRRMQKLGAGSYIQKPYSMEELARAVRTELDRKP